jgi:membrane-bound serine protease (ClpP class)
VPIMPTIHSSVSKWNRLAAGVVLTGLVLALAPMTLAAVSEPTSNPADNAAVSREPAETFEKAMIIPIQREITEITLDSVQRRLDRAKAEQVPLVVLELDTPGGALGPTLEICDAIKQARTEGIKVYAWVNNQAYSAGTIIALATDGVVMSANATMGDCQPIMFTEKGPAAIPAEMEAKAMSPLLEELRDSAYRNGYDLDLVMSLIRPEMQIFWLVNTETGERDFADVAGRNRLFGLDSADDSDKKAVEPVPDSSSKTDWRYVREDPALGQVQQPIVSARELLTMRDSRALAYGFSKSTVSTDTQLKSFLNIQGAIERTELTWMERIVEWLASPVVRAVLFMVMLLGIYAEFHAPGVGLPGAVALIALVLFLGAPYAAGFTVTWEIVVIVLGLALLAIELFVIPGFGVVGIAGLILLGFGLLSSFAPPEPFRRHWFELPEMPQTYRYIRNGMIAMGAGLTGALIGMALLARYLPRAPIVSRIVGRNPTREEVVVEDPYHGIAKVGDIGRAETLLRPAGKARFGAVLVDVVTQGDYLPSGLKVEVIERCGNRVVVRRID